MKNFILTIVIIAAMPCTMTAQSIFNANINADITNAANWTPAILPTGTTTGTLNANATGNGATLVGYNVTQSSNTFSSSGITYDGGSWTVQTGGTYSVRALTINNGAVVTIEGGNQLVGDNNRDVFVDGASSSFVVSSGTVTAQRDFLVDDGGTITFSGGTVTGDLTDTSFGSKNFHTPGQINFNAGTVSGYDLEFGTTTLMSFGGTTSGSVTVTNFGDINGSRHDPVNIRLNFLTGSLVSLTLTNPIESGGVVGTNAIGWSLVGSETGLEWAESLWGDGRLTFNSQDFSTLGNWATVNGSIFDWNGTTNTLGLVPEPSTWALVAIGLSAVVTLRRRRQS